MKFADYLYTALQWTIYVLLLLLGVSFFLYNTYPWGYYAPPMGDIAIILLWIVTIPGILKRFAVTGFLQKVQIILMRCRRRLGVLMYLAAMTHYIWMRVFIYFDQGLPTLSEIPTFEIVGFLTLTILFPLFITSNNPSKKFLKDTWQKIHYLIYIAIWFAALHTSLNDTTRFIKFGVPTILIAAVQIASRVREWETKKKIASSQAGVSQ